MTKDSSGTQAVVAKKYIIQKPVMKGHYKRRKCGIFFHKGHRFFSRKSSHLTGRDSPQPSCSTDLEPKVPPVENQRFQPTATQQSDSSGDLGLDERRVLRPKHQEKKVSSEIRIINNFKMVDMMNSLFRAHAGDRRRHCDNLQVKILQEVKLGLA